jgi:hypothetical protein
MAFSPLDYWSGNQMLKTRWLPNGFKHSKTYSEYEWLENGQLYLGAGAKTSKGAA